MQRVFLGWEESLVRSAARRLWKNRDSLASTCIVVPTAQAGRRLLEAVADLAHAEHSAVLGMRTITPAHFLYVTEADTADDSIELLAWMEVMEGIEDWSPYVAAFPHPLDDEEGRGWSRTLAQSLMDLRFHFQENGMLIRDAATRMGQHHDGSRWRALALLEKKVEELLRTWSLRSRSVILQQRMTGEIQPALPLDCNKLIIIGVTETSAIVAQQWQRIAAAEIWIAAPETEADQFDAFGFPSSSWCTRDLAMPGRGGMGGAVHLTADARLLAEQAVACAAAAGCASDQLTVATTEPALGGFLASAFQRAGWTVFDPAAESCGHDWRLWLHHWQRWLRNPTLAIAAEMAALRETQCLTGMQGISWLYALGVMRDQCLVHDVDDIERHLDHDLLPRHLARETVTGLLQALRHLQHWRTAFFQQGFCASMAKLLENWQREECIDAADEEACLSLLQKWQPWESRLSHDAAFWLQLFRDHLPRRAALMPDERALDVVGWLEIPFHDEARLLLCGMADETTPARCGGEPWLSNSARRVLGLVTDERRHARDAYLYQLILASRCGIDLILCKTDARAKALRPSRLLLQTRGEELAKRVALLFAAVPPADAQLQWQMDWRWQARDVVVAPLKEDKRILSITALRDYLSCPYRFYLRHGLKMNQRDGDRGEWSKRDFGNVLHDIMETWGNDATVRDICDADPLTECWHELLEKSMLKQYGQKPNLALKLQAAALRQRLAWLAEAQARHRASGWQVFACEKPFTIEMGEFTLSGKVDRIDHHPEQDAYMLWDYKTGNVDKDVAKSHLKTITASTRIPHHLAKDPRVQICAAKDKSLLWMNLQLPLYAASQLTTKVPGVGYIAVGLSADKVAFRPWEDFDESLTQSALSCAEWITEQVAANVFWPPVERMVFDDFKPLNAGADIAENSRAPWSLQA
jgi:ATP-dependent helicase/nuclease subunit B